MRVLLTGARAPATLELARLCARAGHTVHVADTYRWHICRGSRHISSAHVLPAPRGGHDAYVAAVRHLVAALRIDVIVPTCEEIFHIAARRDALGARVACESLSVLGGLHDKWRFTKACDAADVRRPATWLLPNADALRTLPKGAYIVKPRYSRFATRVLAWHTGDALPVLNGVDDDGWIAQQCLFGTPLCTWSVSTHGRLDAHVTYATDVTAGPRGAAIAFHTVQHGGVMTWVRQFLAFHRLSGQFAFDFIDTGTGLMAIECNPRSTSGIHCFRDMPDVVRTLLDPLASAPADVREPAPQRYFRSRLALLMYGRATCPGAGLLDAADDPWPRRLQWIAWTHLLASSALAGTDPRRWSTHDIEWNGE
ncbi:MAG: hypothetical protein H7099_08385 [Gemmatimonadaceae bacterium]|nr:hypothetical protein [Gemmatimonadaceae bacterium]